MRISTAAVFLPLFACLASAQSFTNGQAARAVIGQQEFTFATSGTAQNIVGGVSGLAYANGLLFVADANDVGANPQNHRVLVFDTTKIPGPHADLTQITAPSPYCGLCGYNAVNVLGQPNYTGHDPNVASVLVNLPTAVATDGHILAVADTNNNRVLIWNSIPTAIDQAADIVLGASNFTTVGQPIATQTNFRGPQGIWIQNGKLFVADTQNYRILIWNSIPTQNNQPADLVLGQPNFTTANAPPPTSSNPTVAANQFLNPVSVTSDGTHLFVADLGSNRVLIWNSIPTSTNQPADLVVGQPDLTTAVPNWSQALCASNGTDSSGKATYPARCEATLNYPRYALSDGKRLFIADGGNDRVLIYNSIPIFNGAKADAVLGQPDFTTDIVTSQTITITSTAIDNTASVDTIPSPMSLAWDGTNLYVSDAFNRRVLVFTPGESSLGANSVLNAASEIIRQEGSVRLSVPAGGAITANDTATITIAGTNYTYTVKKDDSLDAIAQGLVSAINANNGDPNATAIFAGAGTGTVYLSSKGINLGFDTISLAASTSNSANLTATASGSYLTSGTAATGSAGMLVEINGTNLSDRPSNDPDKVPDGYNGPLPLTLGGAQVFMDGVPAPVVSASATQVIAEIPFSFTNGSAPRGSTSPASQTDRNSTSIYVRTVHGNGSITTTNATPMYIAPANPGLFNAPSSPNQPRPWPAIGARHQPTAPTAVVSIDGTAKAGDTATISVNGRAYTYTVKSGDTLASIRDGLIALIQADPQVTPSAGAAFTRVVLTAKSSGPDGNGIPITGSANSGAQVTVTAYTSATCCLVTPRSLITPDNPAAPGELITLTATGLGVVADTSGNVISVTTGQPYNGPQPNSATNTVSATINGVTAQVISAGLPTGAYGVYEIQLIVPSALPTNAATQAYVAQNAFISNTVTIPVGPAVQVAPPVGGSTNPDILLNPTNLVFANQSFGSSNSSKTQTVAVSNPSSMPLGISGVQVTGANAADFVATNSCPTTLAPGTSCTVTVTYTPSGTGIETASLQIVDSAPGSPQLISLTGTTVSQFQIVSKLSGKVLDVVGGSGANGALIQQWDFLGGNNQKWTLVPTTGDYFAIMNVQSGKVLDVRNMSLTGGAVIQQFQYWGGLNQQWTLTPVDNGYYVIVNAGSGKVLDVTNTSTADGAIIQQWDYVGGENQKWQLMAIQAYQIVNLQSRKVLDVTNTSTADGAEIQQWDYVGGKNQQWELEPVDSQYYRIVNVLSGKVLEVTNSSTTDGAIIQQWDWMGGDNQKWALVPSDVSGYYAIVNKLSGKVLDVYGGSVNGGALIQQWGYLGGNNQKWKVVPVGLGGAVSAAASSREWF